MQQLQTQDPNQNSNSADSLASIQLWLVEQIAEVLSLDANAIDIQQPLTRYGLDSIDAVTLVGDLEDWLDLELPSTLLWDYPTIEKASNYMVEEFDVVTP
jgi:acyl carrier protein